MEPEQLKQHLVGVLNEINTQISVVIRDANTWGCTNEYEMRLPDGSYVLAPLITAKAQVLSALAMLEEVN